MYKFLFLLVFFFSTSVNGQVESDVVLDQRDNKSYQTINLGDQVWFTENLRYKTEKSLCYKRRGKNCEDFGRLYRYDELDKVCPEGFRVPKVADWEVLKLFFENESMINLMAALKIDGVGYQFEKRTFIGKGSATSIWINQMNKYAEFYHVHLHTEEPMHFIETDFRTHEIFHAHPIEGLKNRKLSIRCMRNTNSN